MSREDPLEKEMATHSSILAWEIPWTEETGRLQSMGSQKLDRLSDQTTTNDKADRVLTVSENCAAFFEESL